MRLTATQERPERQVGRHAIFDEIAAGGMVVHAHSPSPCAGVIGLVALVACAGVGACTYNFDKFASAQDAQVGAGGSSGGAGGTAGSETRQGGSGGTTSATGGASSAPSPTGGASRTTSTIGGAAGTLAVGGQAGAGGGGAPSGGRSGADAGADTNTGSCAGSSRGGICWYLGPQGSSCQQVCTGHGQPALSAATHVGTASQGGSLSECGILFGLLGVSGTPTNGARSDGLGLGCHVYGTTLWWLNSPNFSASASHASAKLVCGCTQ